MTSRIAASEGMAAYFDKLAEENDECYRIAEVARSKGLDPETFVEVPRAEDLASRVEKLLVDYQVDNVAEDIRRLTAEHGNREVVALMIAREIAGRPAETLEQAVDRAVRVGLAVLTEGILVAPLEGIADTRIKTNADGTNYIDLVFAGPIRAAGGTAQAMSVLIADMVRQALGIGKYIPTPQEIERFNEEIPLYKQIQHLQYTPSPEEIGLIVSNCPICIDGEGTEQVEVGGFRDLPRIETNKVRGGACLVISEGMCLKASKLKGHVDRLGIEGWDFIAEYLEAHSGSEPDDAGDACGVEPSFDYLNDLLAGRPIFGHPCVKGGFRLRYGRARTTGLAALAYSPATMYVMDEFMALGTQLKTERPGKGCVVTPCDMLEGPHVLLDNGDLVYCEDPAAVAEVRDRIVEIVDNGEILVPFGEFCENNHLLVPCGYVTEWHREELLAKGELPDDWEEPDYARAREMSAQLGVPLHPRFNLMWSDLGMEELTALQEAVAATGRFDGGELSFAAPPETKRTLEDLCVPHRFRDGRAVIGSRYSQPMADCLGLAADGDGLRIAERLEGGDALEAVSAAAGYEVRARAMTRIGARMGRPEKAKERDLVPKLHTIFPVGTGTQPRKDIESAVKTARIGSSKLKRGGELGVDVEINQRRCPECDEPTFRTWCRDCRRHTVLLDTGRRASSGNRPLTRLNIEKEFDDALENLGERAVDVKCMDKLTSKDKVPEALEKGVLRSKNDVSVFREGTIRFDMTDIPLTHFKPREIDLTVERARELGYTHDWNGEPLTDPEQIIELRVQDIVPSRDCGDYMVKVARFVDDELDLLYGMDRFYDVDHRDGLIGHLAYALAPHTSGCILCRIIGYSDVRGCYGHPFFHAAKRRNCDGDEDCIILAMDGLLNFSRSFLPNRRGGLMDAPLVLTTRLDPNEIDKEAHNVDCLRRYPLGFYRAAMEMQDPAEVKGMMDLVAGRIGTPGQYEGIGFTHDTADISEGPKYTAYTTLGTMMEKMEAQLDLSRKLRAVDERDVAAGVINKHFMPDMIGNLRSFAAQTVRCTKCGEKYRRIPLRGICTNCGNNLTLTVHEAGVRKYLEVSKEIGEKYDLDEYTRDRIDLLEMYMDSLFNNDKVRKCKLSDFY